MAHHPSDAYLETQVHTASPIRLRLLLIEGAIRFYTQAKEQSAAGDLNAAAESGGRGHAILAEILSGMWSAEGDLAKQQKRIYGFLMRLATTMQLRRDFSQADDVLKVLYEERETWRELVQRHGALSNDRPPAFTPAPTLPLESTPTPAFSFEA
jgi:flagellar protein FliS